MHSVDFVNIVNPRLSKTLFYPTKACKFHEFYYNYKMVAILYCDLYFNHLYATCFLHTNTYPNTSAQPPDQRGSDNRGCTVLFFTDNVGTFVVKSGMLYSRNSQNSNGSKL